MFKKYYLVELVAHNSVKNMRSNCIIESRGLPSLELVFQNCVKNGYPSVNILSVTRVSKKTADGIKEFINSTSTYNDKGVEEMVKKVTEGEKEKE